LHALLLLLNNLNKNEVWGVRTGNKPHNPSNPRSWL